MTPVKMPNKTRTLGEDQPEYVPLDVMEGLEDGSPKMTSQWELIPEEIAALTNGAIVELEILGTRHPPVRLSVAFRK